MPLKKGQVKYIALFFSKYYSRKYGIFFTLLSFWKKSRYAKIPSLNTTFFTFKNVIFINL